MSPDLFGRRFLESLQENRPEEYETLKASGELDSYVEQVDERASAQYQDLLGQLKAQHPLPKDATYPQRVQWADGLAQQARELVLAEVMILPPEDDDSSAQASDPYTTASPPPLSK